MPSVALTTHLKPAARLRAIFILSFLCVLMQSSVSAQGSGGALSLGQQPGAPAGSYALSGFDNINFFNGHLNFHLPLVSLGSRGDSGHTLLFKYEQKWITRHYYEPGQERNVYYATDDWQPYLKPGFSPGVMYGYNMGFFEPQQCNSGSLPIHTQTLTYLTFTAQDGTQYNLFSPHGRANVQRCASGGLNRGSIFTSKDGSAATFVSDADITDVIWVDYPHEFNPSGWLFLSDGTRYRVDGGRITQMRDRHGNRTTFEYYPENQNNERELSRVTDALGRSININYNVQEAAPYGLCTQIIFNGFGGAQRIVRISRTPLAQALRADQTLQTYAGLGGGAVYEYYNPQVPSSIWLPDGRRYRLLYNDHAELARVELPTGGAIEYDHAGGLEGGDADGFFEGTFDGVGGNAVHIYRRVVQRRIYPDGTTLRTRMIISKPEHEIAGQSTGYVEVNQYEKNPDATETLLERERHFFHGSARPTINQSPFADPPSGAEGVGREYRTESYSTTGALLRKVEHDWRSDPVTEGSYIWETITTLADTNQVTKRRFGYDRFHNQTDVWEYDFGSGAPPPGYVRRTRTDYLTTSSGIDYNSHTTAHLRRLPSAQKVYAVNPANGIETLVAQSEMRYDESAYALPDYGEVPGWVNTGTTARGNVTTIRRWLDTTSAWLETHASYDQVGNLRKSYDSHFETDGVHGNVSEVTYADSFSDLNNSRNTYAFPTSIKSIVPDPSGAYGSSTALTTANVYDFSTGLLTSSTDANSQTTGFLYNDPLNRLTRVNLPHGGWTAHLYGRNQFGDYIVTHAALDSRYMEAQRYSDGMGRLYRSFQHEQSDPSKPWLTTDTQYDALGRVRRVSNPYRTASAHEAVNPSERWTTNSYDALGRLRTVTMPDGAVVTTSYSGSEVTVTDQKNKSRRSHTDALGRLTKVVEDPSGLAYETTYAYDALDNLREVAQGQQHRYFMYDSLSRLIRARNPEQAINSSLNLADSLTANSQWSISYAYDAKGNLKTRIDARNLTTTYTYDALNRNRTVSYSDQTPSISREYDHPSHSNTRGRQWRTCSAGDCTDTVGRDAAGRPTVNRQWFLSSLGWRYYDTNYSYNYASSVTGQTYPSGRTASYHYDVANRLSYFGGTLGDGVSRTYANGIAYHELGGIKREQFGTQTPLYHTRQYNVRGQLWDIRLGTLDDGWNWNRGMLVNHYATNDYSNWGVSGPDNNGNVMRSHTYVPHDDQMQGWTLSYQDYEYDSLNRLKKVTENNSHNWSAHGAQTYDYDRWGNRTINAGQTWGYGVNNKQFTVNASTNQLGVPAGEPGSMIYDAAGNLTTDTYSGSGTRLYDAENRITQESAGSGYINGRYSYDGDGRRVRRKVNGQEWWYVYGLGGELLAEYVGNAPAAPQQEYGYRGGELLVKASKTSAGQIYLSDLSWTYATNGWGPVERNLSNGESGTGDGKALTLNGTAYAYGLGVHGDSDVRYNLAGQYTAFISDIGVDDEVGGNGTVVFQVWADGVLLYDSGVMNGSTATRNVNVSVAGRQELRLVVTIGGDNNWYDHADWAGARLVRSDGRGEGVQWVVTDHLGTPRLMVDETGSLSKVTRHDYLPFGEELGAGIGGRTQSRGYSQYDGVRQQYAGSERDGETGLDYMQARYYGSSMGRFTTIDPIALTGERLYDPQTINLYAYARNNPLKYVDPDGEDLRVTTGNGKELFVLDDGKKEVTGITAADLYKKGIQWFEPEADNYMALKSVADGITSFSELKHFTWEQVAAFAEQDRSMVSYRQGGSGDWKASQEGAAGYFLVTVGGMPYWADAVGQIPFAVDYFTDRLESHGNERKAAEETLQKGQKYGEGKIIGGKADRSNTYDNYFILRGAIWAAHRYDATPGRVYGYNVVRSGENHSAIRLSDPIGRQNAVSYGLKK